MFRTVVTVGTVRTVVSNGSDVSDGACIDRRDPHDDVDEDEEEAAIPPEEAPAEARPEAVEMAGSLMLMYANICRHQTTSAVPQWTQAGVKIDAQGVLRMVVAPLSKQASEVFSVERNV